MKILAVEEQMNQDSRRSSSAHTVFTGGRILTMDPSVPEAEAVIIQNRRICAVGGKDILSRHPDAPICDLRGRTLIPGFIDSHIHLSFACFRQEWTDLTGCQTKEDILKRMGEHAARSDNECVIGFPWFDEYYGGIALTREDLDGAFPDKPAILIHTTFHEIVVNSRAGELSGISEPSQGTGLLREKACIPVYARALRINTRRYAELIEQEAKNLHQFGITAIHDPGVTPDAEAAYRVLHAEQRLPVSVLMMPHGSTLLDNRVGDRLMAEDYGTGDESLRVGPVKLFADGASQGTTAMSVMIQGQQYKSGSFRDDFQDMVLEAVRHRYQVCLHSLGNITTDAILDVATTAKNIAPDGFAFTPRLEHLNLLSREQIERLSRLEGRVCIQPQFLNRAAQLNKVPVEEATWFAYRDMQDAGIILGAGSDYPGGFMDARDVITCCSMGATMSDGQGNQVSPEQMMPFLEWLRIYTAGSARIGGQENERGMIREGFVADFVILDRDLTPESPPAVDETWVGGQRVYSRNRG